MSQNLSSGWPVEPASLGYLQAETEAVISESTAPRETQPISGILESLVVIGAIVIFLVKALTELVRACQN